MVLSQLLCRILDSNAFHAHLHMLKLTNMLHLPTCHSYKLSQETIKVFNIYTHEAKDLNTDLEELDEDKDQEVEALKSIPEARIGEVMSRVTRKFINHFFAV